MKLGYEKVELDGARNYGDHKEGLLHRFSFNFISEGLRLKRVPPHPGPACFLGIHSLCVYEIQQEVIFKVISGRIFTG